MDNPENTEEAIKNGQSREYRRGNQKWTIRRNWQHRIDKTKKNKTKTQHNMYLKTTIRKSMEMVKILIPEHGG